MISQSIFAGISFGNHPVIPVQDRLQIAPEVHAWVSIELSPGISFKIHSGITLEILSKIIWKSFRNETQKYVY